MNNETTQVETTNEPSTYSLLISERIFEHFQIHLTQKELQNVLKHTQSIYHQLLQVPLKNVLNGIILQQIYDYQVYAQKLFVDYLVSGEDTKPEGSPGSETREDLEVARAALVKLGEVYSQLELEHNKLIAESQASYIKLSHDLNASLKTIIPQVITSLKQHNVTKTKDQIQHTLQEILIHFNLEEQPLAETSAIWEKLAALLGVQLDHAVREELAKILSELVTFQNQLTVEDEKYMQRSLQMKTSARDCRRQFYENILQIGSLLRLLSDYQLDEVQDHENRESLHFDAEIGGQ